MSLEKQYFGTDGIRGLVGESPISPEFIMHLGWAFGKSLKTTPKKVIIGKDTRLSGYMLESALETGLVAAGVDVVQLGPMPTPGISFLTRTMPVCGGIVISASHNPYYDNGIKFFDADGFKLCDEKELLIESFLKQPIKTAPNEFIGKAFRLDQAGDMYQKFCHSSFPALNLNGMRCVVDGAHGAMYQIAPKVFESFGANIETIGCQPNGLNINHQVGSTHPQSLQSAVKTSGAQVGIAFDGDGDRLIMIDELGELVDGDEILFIIARAKQQTGCLVGGVVGTQMTNFGVEKAFEAHNIPFIRAAVGDRYVLEALKHNAWQLGGETSGHLIDLSKATTGDGLMAALLVLEEMARTEKSLHELKQGIEKSNQTMINVPVREGKQIVASSAVQTLLQQQQLRLNGFGRIVLRPSGTEPLVRVMVEGSEQSLILEVAQEIAQMVEQTSLRL